jgi:hypothetical protein
MIGTVIQDKHKGTIKLLWLPLLDLAKALDRTFVTFDSAKLMDAC